MKTAYEILQKHHDYLVKFKDGSIDKPSEYIEENILAAMEEYANAKNLQTVEVPVCNLCGGLLTCVKCTKEFCTPLTEPIKI